jgi:tellurium resistance protein TerD
MAIDLVKGQRVDIGLQQVVVGLGWSPGTDLDLSAFMLGENKKLPSDEFFVFYKNLNSPNDALIHLGDDRSGESSDGDDDESITVKLDQVSAKVTEIIFVASIHDAHLTNQNFGQVRDSYIRIYDALNPSNVLCKYELGEDFSVESCVEFGRLYKRGSQWRFEAIGVGYRHNGNQPLQVLVDKYA